MPTFIEGNADYAEYARTAKQNVMVHQEDDGTLSCVVDGQGFAADNAWQLASRIENAGIRGTSFWLDTVFSEPGVPVETKEGE